MQHSFKKKMKKDILKSIRFTVGGLLFLVIVSLGGMIFNSCQEEEIGGGSYTPPSGGILDNPMDQYGIWHNQCLDKIILSPDIAELTADEAWMKYGEPFFISVLGNDYTPIPIGNYNAEFERVKTLINTHNLVSIVDDMAEEGLLNKGFTSPNITENNYTIMYKLFSYMDAILATPEDDYISLQEKIVECEQQMLRNFYMLQYKGEMVQGDVLYLEYEYSLIRISIAKNSGKYWALPPKGKSTEEAQREYMIAADAAARADYQNYGFSGSEVQYSSYVSWDASSRFYSNCRPL